MCKAAVAAAGFVPDSSRNIRGLNVPDGCTLNYGYKIYMNGVCNTLKYDCDCSNTRKCLCDARGSTFREPTCTDSPFGWKSNNGRTCAEYKSNKWCKPNGYGTGWNSADGSFSDWANSAGVDASQACCACGAGTKTYENFRVARTSY